MASPKQTQPAHPTHESVGAAEHEHGSFPPFDSSTFAPQLIWLAITFGFLYYALSRNLLPRIGAVVEGRAQGIRADLDAADRLKNETEASLKAYEQALGAAKADAAGIAKAQRDALAAQSEKERAAVEAQMAAKVAAAENQIAASKAQAMSAVTEVANQTVGAIVARLTGQSVSADEIARAVAAVRAK